MSKLGQVGHRLYTGEVQYDFVGRKKIWYCLSALIVLVAVASILFRGLNFGIEFKGGGDFSVPSANCSIEEVREAVEPLTDFEPIVQETSGAGVDKIRVQTEALPQGVSADIISELAQVCQIADRGTINANVIGAIWGDAITEKAVTSLVVFLILVTVLIRIMFEFKMSVAALFALTHDLIITAGLYALVGFEVTPATIIGMLTILGYSLYDTIVVFDSLRENTRNLTKTQKSTYSEAANLSVNQTLIRSINTSVIALLPVGAILVIGTYLLGAGVLKDLSLVLFIGIAASTFSSIFFATPLLADLKEREPEIKELRRKVLAARAKAERSKPAPPAGPTLSKAPSGTSTALLEREADLDGEGEHGVHRDHNDDGDDGDAGPGSSAIRAGTGPTGVGRFTGAPVRPQGRPQRPGSAGQSRKKRRKRRR